MKCMSDKYQSQGRDYCAEGGEMQWGITPGEHLSECWEHRDLLYQYVDLS